MAPNLQICVKVINIKCYEITALLHLWFKSLGFNPTQLYHT